MEEGPARPVTIHYRRGVWAGAAPLAIDALAPPPGAPVVYALFGEPPVGELLPWWGPCYIGSTGDLRARLKAHQRGGRPFVRWAAELCVSRSAAYSEEKARIREWMPYGNVVGNPRVDRGFAAVVDDLYLHVPLPNGFRCHFCVRRVPRGEEGACNGARMLCLSCASGLGWRPTGPARAYIRRTRWLAYHNPELARAHGVICPPDR